MHNQVVSGIVTLHDVVCPLVAVHERLVLLPEDNTEAGFFLTLVWGFSSPIQVVSTYLKKEAS